MKQSTKIKRSGPLWGRYPKEVNEAWDKLSDLLEDGDSGNDEIRDAAVWLCVSLEAGSTAQARQLCSVHPKVDYRTAWGCPDCIVELRAHKDALVEVCKAAALVLTCNRYSHGKDEFCGCDVCVKRRDLEHVIHIAEGGSK